MSRNALMSVALVVAAVLGTLVVVLLARGRGPDGEPVAIPEDEPPIQARTDISPRVVLFGDTVTALVEVTLDRNRVDPDSVRVQADFSPWRRIGNPERVRRDAETTTSVRTSFVLRCVTNGCVSNDAAALQNDTEIQAFGQAQVTYTAPEEKVSTGPDSLQVPWPRLTIGARFSARDAQSAAAATSGWRADLLSLPAVTYSVMPGRLLALLLAAGTVLAIAAGAFARLARRRRAPPARMSADVPPKPLVAPLDRALALLEDSARVDGAADQRRALELVAAALAERGDPKLAHASRALAWSEAVPGVRETSGLAVQARSALGKELHGHPE